MNALRAELHRIDKDVGAEMDEGRGHADGCLEYWLGCANMSIGEVKG